ncbi:hypothetical protein E2C01_063285 [Portunus trituberculatus]|uniref:Uncharacterized protein n=1 Tax=Portunus trituberculatus TaxID=210409 RepID=A0A5B7HH58_PORTR|nr:hypothetical protein [Portunus trituberculatus]
MKENISQAVNTIRVGVLRGSPPGIASSSSVPTTCFTTSHVSGFRKTEVPLAFCLCHLEGT